MKRSWLAASVNVKIIEKCCDRVIQWQFDQRNSQNWPPTTTRVNIWELSVLESPENRETANLPGNQIPQMANKLD